MFPVADASTVNPAYPVEPAIVLPYWTPDRSLMRVHGQPFARIRRLDPAPVRQGFGKPRKAAKYLQPPGSGMHTYLPPVLDWRRVMADTQTPILITEGEAKTLRSCLAGFTTLGLGGVWSFMAPGGSLLEELESFRWYGRDVYIVFDSDAATNPQVVAAEARLVYDLQSRLQAKARVVRLPAGQDGSKQGLDDFLNRAGPDELDRLLRGTAPLSPLDGKIVSLNRALAWIESESLIWDSEDKRFIKPASLVKGSRWSAIKHVTVSQTGAAGRAQSREISVADKWLSHAQAQRYGEAIFRPGEPAVTLNEEGRPAMNLWTELYSEPGPVKPFFDLCEHIFQNLPEELRDIPWKLFAYKAQRPYIKIPMALVLIGTQGSGKTLWGEIIRDAFGPYGKDVIPSQLYSGFQGWIERSLIGLINEASGEDMQKASEQIKALISDVKRPLNEKYRVVRDVMTYTQYIITSNNRAVGSYSSDDRRMFVISTPVKREKAFYDRIRDWKLAGGPRHLYHWFKNYDLKGWEPPQDAPETPEKVLAWLEGLTPVQKLAADMRNATDQTIYLWLLQAETWAQQAELGGDQKVASHARAVRATIAQTQIRPWYTPEELAHIFPSIMLEVSGQRYDRTTPVGRLSRELRDAGIPYLVNPADVRGYMWKGFMRQYLVVAQFDEWKTPLTQNKFEYYMGQWPTFAQYRRARQ